jgi:small subunit ribosomal protein S18
MGARSNRTLKQKPKVSPALNKKFKKKPCSFCRDKVNYIDYKDVAPALSINVRSLMLLKTAVK